MAQVSVKEEIPQSTKQRIDWRKCDRQEYRSIIEEKLQDPVGVPGSRLEADLMLMQINSVLYSSSCLVSKQTSKKKKSKAGLPIWNKAVRDAVQESKVAHAVWKGAGSPTDELYPAALDRKVARRKLKKCIRREVTKKREEFITTLMEANEYDSRTFFKTIKRQRSSKSTNTQLLHYKDGVLKGPEEVADGFASHFEVLATPSEDVMFDDSYRDQVMLDKLLIEDICRGQSAFYPNYYRGNFQNSTDIQE